MAKKGGKQAASKRAAKKREKELKRKAKLARRPPPRERSREEEELDAAHQILDGWRPAIDGVGGLAAALQLRWYTAALIAEEARDEGGRTDAALPTLPSVLAQATTEELVAGLAARGVTVDEAGFRELAARHPGAVALVEAEWASALPAAVADQDWARSAAIALWELWAPEVESDEALEQAIGQVDVEPPEGGNPWVPVLAFWDRIAPLGGIERLRSSGLDRRFTYRIWTLGQAELPTDPDALRELRTMLLAMRATARSNRDNWFAADDSLLETELAIGDFDAMLDRLIEEGQTEPARLLDAAAALVDRDDVSVAQLDRIHDAVQAGPFDGLQAEDALDFLGRIAEARARVSGDEEG